MKGIRPIEPKGSINEVDYSLDATRPATLTYFRDHRPHALISTLGYTGIALWWELGRERTVDCHTMRVSPGIIPAAERCRRIGKALGVWIYDLTLTGDPRFSAEEVERRIARSRVLRQHLIEATSRSESDGNWPAVSRDICEALELLGLWETGDPRVQIHLAAVCAYWRTKHHRALVSGEDRAATGDSDER